MDHCIKNLVIDLGVVLLDLTPQRCYDSFRSYGIDNLEELAGDAHKKGLFYEFEKGLITPSVFRDELRKLANRNLTDAQIDTAWNGFLADIPAYKLDLLLRLRAKYMVYLLSNTNMIHWEWIKNHCFEYKGFEAKNFFDHIFLSFEMKQVKPEKGIFEAVMEEELLKPEETFLIDDSTVNCQMAKSLGWQTYTPKAKEDWSHLFEPQNA